MQRYDLAIIGGGLVGAGLALALRHTGLKLALIDAKLPSHHDPRLFALNNGSCHFLETLELWQQLLPHATPIHQVHVSNQGHFGAVRLRREEVNVAALGHVIPAGKIEEIMHTAVSAASSIDVYRPALLKALKQEKGSAVLTLTTDAGELQLASGIVIGADGTESAVRKLVGIQASVFDYQQSAIVTRTRLQRAHDHIAYERFTRDGAIAMLPLTGTECATIWTASNSKIAELMVQDNQAFLNSLQTEFGYRLGRLQDITQRHTFPLRMMRAEKAAAGCVFLLGNSAHTLHPIAAQGFNLALHELNLLVTGITEKIAQQETFTALDLLKISEQTQKQQAMSIGLSHRLAQAFSADSLPMNAILSLGMLGLDIAPSAKKKFINLFLGRTSRTICAQTIYEQTITTGS